MSKSQSSLKRDRESEREGDRQGSIQAHLQMQYLLSFLVIPKLIDLSQQCKAMLSYSGVHTYTYTHPVLIHIQFPLAARPATPSSSTCSWHTIAGEMFCAVSGCSRGNRSRGLCRVCMCSRQLEALARLAASSTSSFRPGTGAGTGNLAASCSSIWNAFFLSHFSHFAWFSLPCDCWANIFLISCLKTSPLSLSLLADQLSSVKNCSSNCCTKWL